MRQYLTIIKTAWQRQLTYRVNFVGFRLGGLLEITTQIIIWSVIFQSNDIIRGYSYQEMITYVLIGWLFLFMTSNFGIENVIARNIHKGDLSNFITKEPLKNRV